MATELITRERCGGETPPRKLRLAAPWAGLALLAVLSCGGSAGARAGATQAAPAQNPQPPGRELTDELGRKIQLPQEVKRVVSLAPNLTEIVFALGRGIRLVGDTDYCDYPPEAEQKPHVGGPVNPNLEVIAALKPDLILASGSINRPETVHALDRIGLPVFVTYPHSVEGMIASVEHIGAAIGADKSAAEMAQDLRDRLAELQKRVGGSAPRRVLFVVWTDPLISIGTDTFIADALRLAGGRSAVETKGEWPHISLEEIVHLQPDILVFASAHGSETHREIDELRDRPGWKDLIAMQQDHVVVVSDAINRPAPRMVDVIERMARAFHPEAFTAGATLGSNSSDTLAEVCACAR
ncbi:MAG TPA: cobalamin-binding protein [Verrucomicrobiae bacterium]|jgi:iron complex transport system substrate-binding protein|nr:cobalamin-binding protein [Verrucomicrobiae bacterium]